MPRTLALTVVMLVALAGCPGSVPWLDGEGAEPTATIDSSGSDPTARPIGDATETDTPTATASPDPDYLAPGVTDEGVENVSLLLATHYSILERESENGTYVAVYGSNSSEGSFPPRLTTTMRDRYVVDYPERLYNRWTRTDHTTNETRVYESWANSSVALHLSDYPDRPPEYRGQLWSTTPGHPGELDRILRLHLAYVEPGPEANVTVEERGRDGTTVYVVSRTTDRTTQSKNTIATTTFYVREDGFITHYTISASSMETNSVLGTRETRITETYLAFEIHPDRSLDPPEWVEDAHREIGDGDDDEE